MSGCGEPQGWLSFPLSLGHASSSLRFFSPPVEYFSKASGPPLQGYESGSSLVSRGG